MLLVSLEGFLDFVEFIIDKRVVAENARLRLVEGIWKQCDSHIAIGVVTSNDVPRLGIPEYNENETQRGSRENLPAVIDEPTG